MATTFTLKRKLFATGETSRAQLVEEYSQGGNARGYKKLHNSYQKATEAANNAMSNYTSGYSKWAEAQTAAGVDAKNITKAAYNKTGEAQGLLQAARDAQHAHTNISDQIITKGLGKNSTKTATQAVQERQRFNAGLNAGKNSVGAWQGIKNTYNSGFGGKAKLAAAGAALIGSGALIGKAVSGKKE